MTQLQTKWIADDAVNDTKIKLRSNQPLRARNAADDADVELFRLDVSNDLILKAGAKIGANVIATTADIPATFHIQGNWNAATNTPTLVSSTNSTGFDYPLYIVNVAGATTIDGYSDWVVGDKIYFANGQWYKADNNDAVVSVNSQSGVVVLSTTDIGEGTNLYHTGVRAQTAAVVDSTAGNETVQAASVASMKTYVGNQIATVQQDFGSQVITLAALDITNGYVDLAQNPIEASLHVFVSGGLPLEPVADYAIDAVVLNRLNFLGNLAALAAANDKLVVKYAY